MTELITLTSTRLDDWMYCPFKYRTRWIEKIIPKVKNLNLVIGEAVHLGLEKGVEAALREIMMKYPNLRWTDLYKIEAMLTKAFEYLRMPETKEVEYQYQLKNIPVIFKGKLDGDSETTIYEFKTTKSFSKPLQLIVSNDIQHRFYALLKKLATGIEPKYVTYARLKKTMIRPKKKKGGELETKEEFRDRVIKTYSSSKMFEQNTFNIYWMDRFMDDLKEIVKVFYQMHLDNSFYRSWNCRKEAQSDCDYMRICTKEEGCMMYYHKEKEGEKLEFTVEETEKEECGDAVPEGGGQEEI